MTATQTWYDERGHAIPPPPPYPPPTLYPTLGRTITPTSPYLTPAPRGLTVTPRHVVIGVIALILIAAGVMVGSHRHTVSTSVQPAPAAAPAAAAADTGSTACQPNANDSVNTLDCYHLGYNLAYNVTLKTLRENPDIDGSSALDVFDGLCGKIARELRNPTLSDSEQKQYVAGCVLGDSDAVTYYSEDSGGTGT